MTKKLKICSEAETGWVTAQLGHDTMEFYRDIAVLGVQQQATMRPGHAHDMAWQGHDTTDLRTGRGQRARMAWPLG